MCHTCYTCPVCTFVIHAPCFTYVIHITHILSIANAVDVPSALVPEEGDDFLEQVNDFGADHLHVAVGPTEGVAHEAPDFRALGGLVKVFDAYLGALEAVAKELLFRLVQHGRVLDELLLQMVPDNLEGLSFFQEEASHLKGVNPFLLLRGSRDIHPVQEIVGHQAGDGGKPGVPRREIHEKVVKLISADIFIDSAGDLDDVIGLIRVDFLTNALNRIGLDDLATHEIIMERSPFLASRGQIVLAETAKGELFCLKVDDLDGLAQAIPDVRGKKKGEGGFPASTLRGKERKRFHNIDY